MKKLITTTCIVVALIALQLTSGMAHAQFKFPIEIPPINIKPPTIPPINIKPPTIPPINIKPPTIPPIVIPPINIKPPTIPPINLDPIGRELDKMLKDAEKWLKQAGRDVDSASRDAERYVQRNLRQHSDMLSKTSKAWEDLIKTDYYTVKALVTAIENKNVDRAVQLLGKLILTNHVLRDAILKAQDPQNPMGSLLLMAGGGGQLIVGVDGAVGLAVDIDSLAYFVKRGRFPSDRINASVFVAVGISVGASGGGSLDLAVGYNINDPHEIQGPSLDLNASGAAGVGGGGVMSFDPTTAPPQMSQIVISGGVGAKIDLSGGLGFTHILTERKVYSKPSAGSRPPTSRPVTKPRPTRPVTRPFPTRPVTKPRPTRPVTRPFPTRPVTKPRPTRPVTRPFPSRPVTRPNPFLPVTKPRPVTRPLPSWPVTRPVSKPRPTRPVTRPQPPRRQPVRPAVRPRPSRLDRDRGRSAGSHAERVRAKRAQGR